MSALNALITLVTLIAVPLLGYFVTGAWWGGVAGFLVWLLAVGYFSRGGKFSTPPKKGTKK